MIKKMTNNRKLLQEVKDLFQKSGFVPSPQTQEGIAAAQQQGAIPPPDPAQQQQQVDPMMEQLAGLIQEGFNAVLQGQQQLMQLIQQQAATMQQGGGQKKPSTNERIEMLEKTIAQLTQGGMPAGGSPEDMAASQVAPAPAA